MLSEENIRQVALRLQNLGPRVRNAVLHRLNPSQVVDSSTTSLTRSMNTRNIFNKARPVLVLVTKYTSTNKDVPLAAELVSAAKIVRQRGAVVVKMSRRNLLRSSGLAYEEKELPYALLYAPDKTLLKVSRDPLEVSTFLQVPSNSSRRPSPPREPALLPSFAAGSTSQTNIRSSTRINSALDQISGRRASSRRVSSGMRTNTMQHQQQSANLAEAVYSIFRNRPAKFQSKTRRKLFLLVAEGQAKNASGFESWLKKIGKKHGSKVAWMTIPASTTMPQVVRNRRTGGGSFVVVVNLQPTASEYDYIPHLEGVVTSPNEVRLLGYHLAGSKI